MKFSPIATTPCRSPDRPGCQSVDTAPSISHDVDIGQWGLSEIDRIRGFNVSIDHVQRLTIRIHVGAYHREVDLALPGSSCLGEVLEEVLRLSAAPRISRPWQATTAAGVLIDQSTALNATELEPGSVVVLSPAVERPAPVIRDAAESLVETTAAAPAAGLTTATSVIGAVAMVVTLLGLPSEGLFTPALLLAGAGLGCLAVLVWRRQVYPLGLLAIVLAGAAAATAVLAEVSLTPESVAWAAGAGVLAAAATLLGTVIMGVTGTRTTAAVATVLLFLGLAAAALAITGTPVGTAAAVVAGAVLMILAAPALATQWSGLRVAALPSAGQDLKISDTPDTRVNEKSARAVHLHEGILLGVAGVLIPAVTLIGWSGGGFAQGLGVATAGAVLLHSARHRSRPATWALFLSGLAAVLALVLAAANGSGHPAQLLLAGAVALTALSTPLWVDRVPQLQPTTILWLERLESLAVAATIPLAAHLMGVFAAIRGLG